MEEFYKNLEELKRKLEEYRKSSSSALFRDVDKFPSTSKGFNWGGYGGKC